ncbi:hypothetical protein [Salinibacterium sp.]|uniref:hypothetical protein n=1 Tax=Salinibacterium sp. TaxID=1915057 RepID=UPI00286A4F7D|nr:hypothetical protein [Salinibacterium sp.]
MKKRLTGGLLAVAVALALGVTPAIADNAPPAGLSPAVEQDLVVLPAELLAYGFSEEEAAAAQTLLDALSPEQLAFQNQLRLEQDKVTSSALVGNYFNSLGEWVPGDPDGEGPLTEVVDAPIVNLKGGGSTDTVPQVPCQSGDYHVKFYHSEVAGYLWRCYSGLGSLTGISIPRVKSHYGGGYESRLFYHHNGNYFWSVWRIGYTEYNFDELQIYGSVTGYGVERRQP